MVEQEWSICDPKFVIKDGTGEPVLRIEGPLTAGCGCECCSDVDFVLYSITNDQEVWKILVIILLMEVTISFRSEKFPSNGLVLEGKYLLTRTILV